MRMVKRVAAVAMVAGLFIGPVAGAASAATRAPERSSQVRLTGGNTSVTTAPGITAALLEHGIVPLATVPGSQGAQAGSGGVTVQFTFPVTGGWSTSPSSGAPSGTMAASCSSPRPPAGRSW